jgi:hypothetical protein
MIPRAESGGRSSHLGSPETVLVNISGTETAIDFYSRYPRYVRNFARRYIGNRPFQELQDMEGELTCFLLTLPEKSKYRSPGANGKASRTGDRKWLGPAFFLEHWLATSKRFNHQSVRSMAESRPINGNHVLPYRFCRAGLCAPRLCTDAYLCTKNSAMDGAVAAPPGGLESPSVSITVCNMLSC